MPFPAALTWMLIKITFDLPRVLQWAFMRRTRSDRGMSSGRRVGGEAGLYGSKRGVEMSSF